MAQSSTLTVMLQAAIEQMNYKAQKTLKTDKNPTTTAKTTTDVIYKIILDTRLAQLVYCIQILAAT